MRGHATLFRGDDILKGIDANKNIHHSSPACNPIRHVICDESKTCKTNCNLAQYWNDGICNSSTSNFARVNSNLADEGRQMRRLVIDDFRTFPDAFHARTYWEGILQLDEEGPWNTLYLDHDLGCFTTEGKELTGYDVLTFLEKCPEFIPDEIILVTANPVAKNRMLQALQKMQELYQKPKSYSWQKS